MLSRRAGQKAKPCRKIEDQQYAVETARALRIGSQRQKEGSYATVRKILGLEVASRRMSANRVRRY